MLTREQIEHYRREGYIVVESLLGADTLAELRRVTDEVVATAHGITDHTKVLDLEPSHTPERPRVRRIKSPHLAHPFYWDMAGHPPVMAALEPLIGPHIRVRPGGKVNLKSPASARPSNGTRTGPSTRIPTTTCSRSASSSTTWTRGTAP